jgi:DNA-binding transcriptional LysR family regulator
LRAAYLAQAGVPQTPQDLSSHQIILANSINQNSEMKFGKAPLSVRVKPQLLVSDNALAIEAALSGLGIVRVLSYQIAARLAAGSLKIILSEYELAPLPVHIVHSEGRYGAAKVRAFIDLMVEHLRDNLRVVV